MFHYKPVRQCARFLTLAAALAGATPQALAGGPAEETTVSASALPPPTPIVHRISEMNERMDMLVNSSRIITLDQKIPRAQVNNRDILELTPLGPNEIQIFAKKAGITQINLWNEKNQIHSLDVVVTGDAQELTMLLKTQFPHTALKVIPTPDGALLTGYVDRSDQVTQIIDLAKSYYPKVIPSITVGGVQQVTLRVKVIEISRTKLRALGTDFATASGGDFFVSSVSGLLDAAAASGGSAAGLGGDTVRFGFVDGNTKFFAFLDFLRKNDLAKICAEPNVTTVSGRPAYFAAGGEFPILVPQSLGTSSIDYKQFGTRVDFVPIVLGNGNIRLEVKPRVSEIDATRSVTVGSTSVPALRTREVDTAVEMKPGQTLALAGLVQIKDEATSSGIPYLADLPYIGVAFRHNRYTQNEVELLILVTPEITLPMNPDEVPTCLPGSSTVAPNDHDFYWGGMIEKPACGPCAAGMNCLPHNPTSPGAWVTPPADGMQMAPRQPQVAPLPEGQPPSNGANAPSSTPNPEQSTRTDSREPHVAPAGRNVGPAQNGQANVAPTAPRGVPGRYNSTSPQDPHATASSNNKQSGPGFIGPLGYDVVK